MASFAMDLDDDLSCGFNTIQDDEAGIQRLKEKKQTGFKASRGDESVKQH